MTGILRTKLHRPPVGPDLVSRSRLLRLMDGCLTSPLTLVSAPAGYGKSVLVSQWAEALELPCGWLSLDTGDSDFRGFLSYFLATIETFSPGACPGTRELLEAADLPLVRVVADQLINDLDALGGPQVIVLDDYHSIDRSSLVHEFIERLVEYPPSDFHLVLITRRDPSFSVLNLRADHRMMEIRMKELRFSEVETGEFLSAISNCTLDGEALTNLHKEVEGWAVGLRLVKLAIRHAEDAGTFLKGLTGGLPQTQEYLLREVLTGLPPELRECMLRASVLDRFCSGILDAVCWASDPAEPSKLPGRQMVALLQQHNLFTIRLDARGEWFRYHHLFKDLLGMQLRETKSPEEIAKLHSRASAWFESQGLITEAIQQALAAGDEVGAAEIVERYRKTEQDEDRWRLVDRWLDLIPDGVRDQRPSLLLAQAWSAYQRYQFERMGQLIDRAASLLEDSAQREELLGELRFLQGGLQFWLGDLNNSQRSLEEARSLLPDATKLAGGEPAMLLGLVLYMNGEGERGVQLLRDGIREIEAGDGIHLSRLLAGLSFLHFLSGDLAASGQEADRFRSVAIDHDMAYTQAWGRYMEGCTRLHVFDLDGASTHLAALAQQRYLFHPRGAIDGLAGLSLCQQLRGEGDDADATLDTLETYAQDLREPHFLSLAHSFRARLSLLRGDLTSALQWTQRVEGAPGFGELFFWLEVPELTRARVMIALGSPGNLREATVILRAVQEVSERYRFTCQAIEVSVLQALVQVRSGNEEKAGKALADAVKLASPGRWIRPFIEAGPDLAELLVRMDAREGAGWFVKQVLQAFDHAGPPSPPAGQLPFPPPLETDGPVSRSTKPHIATLTNREIDVLELLAQRLQDKEIASRLFISTHTVNDHLKRTYRKLGVSGRRQAVERAVQLGFIRPE